MKHDTIFSLTPARFFMACTLVFLTALAPHQALAGDQTMCFTYGDPPTFIEITATGGTGRYQSVAGYVQQFKSYSSAVYGAIAQDEAGGDRDLSLTIADFEHGAFLLVAKLKQGVTYTPDCKIFNMATKKWIGSFPLRYTPCSERPW